MNSDTYPPVPPLQAGLGCRCPRCGRGKLYRGLLTVAANCSECDLDYSPHDSGDGPAVLVMFLLCALVIPLVLWFEFAASPPYWQHAVIWPPVVVILAIGLLRPAKALLVALHYKNLRHKYDGGT
jgi:uncharacterized protein (DUF983 family)